MLPLPGTASRRPREVAMSVPTATSTSRRRRCSPRWWGRGRRGWGGGRHGGLWHRGPCPQSWSSRSWLLGSPSNGAVPTSTALGPSPLSCLPAGRYHPLRNCRDFISVDTSTAATASRPYCSCSSNPIHNPPAQQPSAAASQHNRRNTQTWPRPECHEDGLRLLDRGR
jgi:hypothetical protein